MASDICQDCGVSATTFNDPNDGGLYCYECWIQFYGIPPAKAGAVAHGVHVQPSRSDVKDLLPEDAPRGHPAHHAVKYQSAKKVFSFQWQGGGGRIPFQTTVPAAGNSKVAAEVIARACYMKFEQGWTKDKILEWRNQCYARLGGRAPSLLTSQAASQRVSRCREAPARSRSHHRDPQPSATKGEALEKPLVVERKGEKPSPKDALKSRSPGETFLPPNHLKLLLDNPQAPLPKSQVKIRSQGVAFSQASQIQSQKDFERGGSAEHNFKSQEEGSQRIQQKRARNGELQEQAAQPKPLDAVGPPHGCCCCRARCSSTCAPVCNGGRVEDDSAQKRPFTAKAVPMEQGWEPFERRSEEVKRSEQNMDPVDSIFAELKKLKEEPPESQHGPESQPTPFIYEPPVVDQEVEMDTLPTPAVETPLPVPEPQTVPVPVQIVHETLTPWCTQPTPKVDATDWLFISDPTPMPPEKENQDGGIPELTQATPVPPAPIGTKPPSDSREKEDSFAETAIDKEKEEGDALERKGTEPKAEQPRCAADSGIFPEISIDIVTDLVGQKPPVPPVPAVPVQVKQLPKGKSPGKTGAEVSFAAMLLQRMRAAKRDSGANQKVSDRAEQDEQNPESAHPPAQVAPEDIHPLVRATI